MGLKQEKCKHRGCKNLQTSANNNYKGQPGVKYYRKWCQDHYTARRAKNAGVTKAAYSKQVLAQTAAKAGLSVSEYTKQALARTAAKAGLTVAEYQRRTLERSAAKAGFDSINDYLNSKHPYRKHRKNYCENHDGSVLGYKCTYPKTPFKEVSALLQVDHIDGDPTNNDPSNLQTLCPNCHTYKTHIFEDYRTPGRKKLKSA